VGGASPVLRRSAAGCVLLAALAAYFAWQGSLPRLSLWGEVAFAAFVLVPAVFALVWLLLPLRAAVGLLPVGLAAAALVLAFQEAGWHVPADFVKLGGTTALAFAFLRYFESPLWVALVALIVPWVDIVSVHQGPTHAIVHHHQAAFDWLSFAFLVPGNGGALHLGIPDLLFFALFLAAAARWQLRVAWTWLALVASLGGTMALSIALDTSGLPALPGLALGFLLPNADLLLAEVRRARRPQSRHEQVQDRHEAGTDTRPNPR
jgi:hypothetical protein